MKLKELRQIIREELEKIKESSYPKYKREVELMTHPKVQEAWVAYYENRIKGKKLRQIIEQICVGFDKRFYFHVEELEHVIPILDPSSSGSLLYNFYQFDIQDITDLSDEEFKELFSKMNRAYHDIINKLDD